MTNEMREETNGMKEQMKELRGEMRQVGQCLQAGKRAPPSAATNKLRGSAPAGEDRAIRETCWARREEVTETVTRRKKLNGVTETCTIHIETRETGRQVTELTETREVVERLHGVEEEEEGDAHTHIQIVERLHGVEGKDGVVGDAHTRAHTHTHTHTHRLLEL